jgi:hypothetical protein
MLEWSQANEWRPPPGAEAVLLEAHAAWTGSDLFATRVRGATRVRAETPLLLPLAGTVLRGSIDLLVEREGEPPLVVDYKTDRLGGATPAECAEHYEVQRDIYALAVAEALGAPVVDVAYVFLERPEEPLLETLDRAAIEAGRQRLEETIERLAKAGDQIVPDSLAG